MSFMVPNEFLIIIYPGAYWEPLGSVYAPSLEERISLRKAGIQTGLEYPNWSLIEPSKGEYDFSSMEEMLKLNREADQKTIFNVPGDIPPIWMWDEWMAKDVHGNTHTNYVSARMLSFWNEEAQNYLLKYYEALVKEYQAADIMFIHAEHQSGEGIMPGGSYYHDEFAVANYKEKYGTEAYPDLSTQETKDWLQETIIEKLVREHKIINQHNEIWNMQQLLMDDWSKTYVNYAQKDILRAYKKAFPEVHLVLLQYTYWDSSHTERHRNYVDEIKEEFQCDVIVEAMWPAGLAQTTPASIAKGYRGQIVGVSYATAGVAALQPEVRQAIQGSHQQWFAARGE